MTPNKEKRTQIRRQLYEELSTRGVDIVTTIKSLRKIVAQDQTQFAKFVGISISTLRRIEQNHDNVELQSITKILKKFGLSIKIHTSA